MSTIRLKFRGYVLYEREVNEYVGRTIMLSLLVAISLVVTVVLMLCAWAAEIPRFPFMDWFIVGVAVTIFCFTEKRPRGTS